MNAPRENEMNIPQEQHERLCAYVFGELEGADRETFAAELAASPTLQAEQARLEATIGLVKQAMPDAALSGDARRDLFASARRSRFPVLRGRGLATLAAALVALVGGAFAWRWLGDGAGEEGPFRNEFGSRLARAPEPSMDVMRELRAIGYSSDSPEPLPLVEAGVDNDARSKKEASASAEYASEALRLGYGAEVVTATPATPDLQSQALTVLETGSSGGRFGGRVAGRGGSGPTSPGAAPGSGAEGFRGPGDTVPPGGARSGRRVAARGAPDGAEASEVQLGLVAKDTEALRGLGYVGDEKSSADRLLDLGHVDTPEEEVMADAAMGELDELGYGSAGDDEDDAYERRSGRRQVEITPQQVLERAQTLCGFSQLLPGESPRDMFFRYWGDNPFVLSLDDVRSTFAVDVDTASYTLTRAYLSRGQLPPREAVRSEEFVNYFRADQPAPSDGSPFAIGLELAPTPFTPDGRTELLRVTVRAKDVADFERQPLALTFVVDVSGSMQGERIALVKKALTTLLGQLYAGDSVAIVAFANQATEISPMVSAGNRGPLESAIAGLSIQGGTNVEAGLRQGYAVAAAALTRNAVNRVILCSDGVGNIGETKGDALLDLVSEHRQRGIYLNTVGVGMGNHNDAFLEQLADKGDGLCQYVDSAAEAQKVFGQDLAKALQPVARDVKIQVEFDPAQVEAWRQIGYENRALRHEDFRNDAIDAGEVNAGHQVSALYEVVRSANPGGPLATVRLRYKPPFPVDRGDTSRLAEVEAEAAREIERAISFADSRPGFAAGSTGFRRSAVAAQFAEVLRRSQHARNDSLATLSEQAQSLASASDDPEVRELAELIAKARPLLEKRAQEATPRLERLLDDLARLHFERGQRERKRLEVDAETLGREEAEIQRLEAEVRQELAQQLGVELPDPETRRGFEDLGYTDDR